MRGSISGQVLLLSWVVVIAASCGNLEPNAGTGWRDTDLLVSDGSLSVSQGKPYTCYPAPSLEYSDSSNYQLTDGAVYSGWPPEEIVGWVDIYRRAGCLWRAIDPMGSRM